MEIHVHRCLDQMKPRNRTSNYGHSFTITRASIFPRLSPTASRPTDRLRLLPASPGIRHHAAPSPTRCSALQRRQASPPLRGTPRSPDRRLQTAGGRRWKARGRTVRRNAPDPPSELETQANPALESPSPRRRKSRAHASGWPLPAFQTLSGYIDAGSPIKGTSRLHRCCDRNGQKFSASV